MNIGQNNTLTVSRLVDFGLYLVDDHGSEVLLPTRYVTGTPQPGDAMDVFVYTDSEDRPIATTEHPRATVGEVAFLRVVDVNRIGAFLDWGLAKDLFVPFSEQLSKMKPGGLYPVYIYLDHASGRVTASAKLNKYIGNKIPQYHQGQQVKALILQNTDIGYKTIVDNLYFGMIYGSDLYKPITPGDTITAYVSKVRTDGKIDLTLSNRNEVESIAKLIADYINTDTIHSSPIDDSASPEWIKQQFGCSKRIYKQALGALYKSGRLSKPTTPKH